MCQSDKNINLGSIVCHISLLGPITEIDAEVRTAWRASHPTTYLLLWVFMHMDPLVLLIFYFRPQKSSYNSLLCSLQADAPPQIHMMPSKTKMFGQALLLHVCSFGMREMTPTRCQCSTTAHPVTLALFYLDQLHIKNRRCNTKTLNKYTRCPPLA